MVDNALLPPGGFDPNRARSWYQKWRKKIRDWLERHADSEWADILLLLPDLFMLAVGLMSDSRIPKRYRLALLSAVLYVLSPLDLIPEAVFGVAGLTDDAGILIILLDLLFSSLSLDPDTLEQVIHDHWHGEDLIGTIKKLLCKLKNMPGNLFRKLKKLVMRWWPSRGENSSETEPEE